MGILGNLFTTVAKDDRDMNAIRKAYNLYKDYKKREAEASEEERKEAEEALSFLKQNGEDPS